MSAGRGVPAPRLGTWLMVTGEVLVGTGSKWAHLLGPPDQPCQGMWLAEEQSRTLRLGGALLLSLREVLQQPNLCRNPSREMRELLPGTRVQSPLLPLKGRPAALPRAHLPPAPLPAGPQNSTAQGRHSTQPNQHRTCVHLARGRDSQRTRLQLTDRS